MPRKRIEKKNDLLPLKAMKENIIYNADAVGVLKTIDGNSVDLVIADPPYFKVIGKPWDYEWRTEDDYVSWCKEWLKEVARVSKLTATFYIFGYIHTLARLIPVIEGLGFVFRQQIVIDKGMKSVSGRHTSTYKMFPTVTESILSFVKDARPFVRDVLKKARTESGLTSKEINERLGVKSNGGGMWSFYQGNNILAAIPTKERWESLTKALNLDIPYKDISFTFNQKLGITDVWNDIDFYTDERKHETQKPRELVKRLIVSSSNAGDLVLDPFSGSGIVCRVAKDSSRRFIGIEKDKTYYREALALLKQNNLDAFTGSSLDKFGKTSDGG